MPHARPNASAHISRKKSRNTILQRVGWRPSEGADYSLESVVRKFVKAPVLAYKPKKGGETDLEIAPILERGMRYIAEFAPADSSEA